MLKQLDDDDWKEAFGYAGEPGTCGSPDIRATPISNVSVAPFTREDVAEIFAMEEGENDGPSWVIAGRLNDGRYFYLEAGCDYTGWDCRAGGSASVASSKEELISFAMTEDGRTRLKLKADSSK